MNIRKITNRKSCALNNYTRGFIWACMLLFASLVDVIDTREAVSADLPLVTDIFVASGEAYTVDTNLEENDNIYIDRDYVFTDVGTHAGMQYIRTANNDKNDDDSIFLRFDLNRAANVYVAYDSRAVELPAWLSGWTETGVRLFTTDTESPGLDVYEREFSAGSMVSLGGNDRSSTGADSMYGVIIGDVSDDDGGDSGHLSDYLLPGDVLEPDQWLLSRNGRYKFKLLTNGNLVLRDTETQTPIWKSHTANQPVSHLILQQNGNLVLRSTSDSTLWSSQTSGTDAVQLFLDNAGMLALYDDDNNAVWALNDDPDPDPDPDPDDPDPDPDPDPPTPDFIEGWQIVKTGYATNDMVVVAMVMTEDNLPSDPANKDCSTAFNNAFKEVSSKGGGVVYAPEGDYLFTKPLIIKPNVVLRGAWGSVHGSDKSVRGTVLKVKYNGLYTKKAPGFIQLDDRAGIRDLTIWYPKQDLSSITPYAQTIDSADDKVDELLIENVNLVNSYVGLSTHGNVKRPFCRGLYGSPLKIGMYQDESSSVPTYTQVYFSADYWSESDLPGSPSRSALKSYLRNSATGIKVGASDNIFASEWHVADYNIGLHFVDEGNGDINGNMYGFYITNCKTALRADSIGPSFIINSVFDAINDAVTLKGQNSVGVFFSNCEFNSSSGDSFVCTYSGSAKTLKFQNCAFDNRLFAGSSYLSVVDSEFDYTAGKPVQLNSKTRLAVLAGNSFEYNGDPVKLNGAKPSVVKMDSKDTNSPTYKPFDVNGYSRVHKPYGYNMIIMGKDGYKVNVDGTTDDSSVIQDALDDVYSMGGGIVLLPQISEKGYAIRKSIEVPEGVELRSSSEGMHSFNGGREGVPAAMLQIYHGRNGSTPTITLNKDSGLKGFTIHYPKQQMNSITPYAVTVKAVGDGAYVKNNHFVNSYAQVELNGSDNHLVENNMCQHVNRNFIIRNCKNGRFNHNFIRGEWDDSDLPTVGSLDKIEKYSVDNNIAYEVTGSSNQQFFASFSRVSNIMALLKNSSVHALQFSMEHCQNGIFVDGIPKGKSVELIGPSLRTDADEGSGTLTMFDIDTDTSDGDFRVFSALTTGHPDWIIKATDADMIFQNSFVRLDDKSTTIKLDGNGPGVTRVENCTFWRHHVDSSIKNVSGKKLELIGNHFQKGLD